MLVVLDTNILVSALLSPFGAPARVLDLALTGAVRLAYDDRIMTEYREVLARPRFGFAQEDVDALLTYLEVEGEKVIPHPLPDALPDPDDLPFLEVAVESGAVLITGNLAHFRSATRIEIQAFAPADFIRRWKG